MLVKWTMHIISPVPRESPFRLPVKKRKVGTYRHTKKNNSTPWVASLNCEYKLMLDNNSWLRSEIINTCMKIIAKQFPHTPISGFQPIGLVPYFDEHTQCWTEHFGRFQRQDPSSVQIHHTGGPFFPISTIYIIKHWGCQSIYKENWIYLLLW